MNDVENEVEEQQAEDGSVNRVPELKQLSEDIDKATNTFINATLELESAIQQYQRAEAKLGGAVTTISKKVDTINQHIDKVLENVTLVTMPSGSSGSSSRLVSLWLLEV